MSEKTIKELLYESIKQKAIAKYNRVYLSGAITSDPKHKAKFEAAKRKYEQKGYKVLSPIETPEYKAKKGNSACLFASIKLLEKADWLIQLDNPEQSKGMQIEQQIADYCNIMIIREYEEEKK